MTPSILDQLNFASADSSQRVAFALLDAMQGIEPKGLQLSGTALMFLLMCEKSKLDPRDVLDKASHILHRAFIEGRADHIRAIQTYLDKEL